MQIRIGNGYDVHRFADQEDSAAFITIGGVKISHTKILLAHSDGDVLIHALCDALLGAVALGDIGQHFPDTDARFKNCNSMELLAHVVTLLSTTGWHLTNADMTLVAQAPRFSPYVNLMRTTLAASLGVNPDQVSVKATTTEGLGFAGRREGIACYAVVLIHKKQDEQL
jgi:2-C-methyl-D-erythritol 2,4-cyclodiphosphate synthase